MLWLTVWVATTETDAQYLEASGKDSAGAFWA